MTSAYGEEYLNDAMENLGEAFDYAVNACGFSLDDFMEMFLVSGYADAFGRGDPKTVAGVSGTELVEEIVTGSGIKMIFPNAQISYDCSPEYWCGWILAYYQWETNQSFRDIYSQISMAEIYRLYPTHHEASEEKFVDTVNAIAERRRGTTKLQRQRKYCGYSQRQLAEKAGVNLRTLQQYENGAKDLSKASVGTVLSLANALGCTVSALV